MAIQNPKRLISVDEYHQMADDGLFAQDERVELIEGEIVEMTPMEPQPDLVLLVWRDDFYASAVPSPEGSLLLVEVSDSSLQYDRCVKMPLYARHGVRESWILSLPEDVLEVYRRPGPDGYAEVRRLRRGDVMAPEALPDAVFAVSDLLG